MELDRDTNYGSFTWGAFVSINALRESFGSPRLKAINPTEEKMQSQQNAGKLLCLMKRLAG
jgi:hypothetical protein